MIELISTSGWKGVSGLPLSGKSTRLLFALHSWMPQATHQDVLWIDFDHVYSAADGCARLASQLHLRRCNQQEELFATWTSILKSMHTNSVVVFDNVNLGLPSWESFIHHLFHISAEFHGLCFVVVSTQLDKIVTSIRHDIKFTNVIRIDMMAPETALRMATQYHPVTKVRLYVYLPTYLFMYL